MAHPRAKASNTKAKKNFFHFTLVSKLTCLAVSCDEYLSADEWKLAGDNQDKDLWHPFRAMKEDARRRSDIVVVF